MNTILNKKTQNLGENENFNKSVFIPIWRKQNLTVAEACIYSGIGEKTIRKLMQNHGSEFVLIVGKDKKLIKRKAFDDFILSRKYI